MKQHKIALKSKSLKGKRTKSHMINFCTAQTFEREAHVGIKQIKGNRTKTWQF